MILSTSGVIHSNTRMQIFASRKLKFNYKLNEFSMKLALDAGFSILTKKSKNRNVCNCKRSRIVILILTSKEH
jgi:hypothetical protein